MESAVLTQLLSTRLPLENPPAPSAAYLAGLLRNLGLLALVHVAPETMNRVFSQVERDPTEELSTVERRYLGLDHAEAGAELPSAWRLPAALAGAMGPVDKPNGGDGLTTLVSLALLCGALGRVLRNNQIVEQDPELGRVLDSLGVRFDAWPALVNQWRERIENIEWLAASCAGAPQ